MGTPLFLLTMLLNVIFVDNQRGAVLLWAFNVLSHFVRMMPRDWRLTLAGIRIPIERGRAPSDIVSDLLQRLGISRMWATVPRADQGVRLPNIESETDGPVPYEYLLYALMRWSSFSPSTLACAKKKALHVTARLLDAAWSSHLLAAPSRSQHLPETRPPFPEGVTGRGQDCHAVQQHTWAAARFEH